MMAEYSTIPVSLRIIVLVLIIVFLVILGFIVINSLGVLDTRGLLSPIYRLFGISTETTIDADDPLLLVHQREKKNLDALALLEEELDLRAKDLATREPTVTEKEEVLAEKEKSLQEAEKSLNENQKELDDRNKKLESWSEKFLGMPPENAVKTMLEMDDQELIEILRVTDANALKNNEQSIVP